MSQLVMAALRPSVPVVLKSATFIPTDPASIFVYVLLLPVLWVVWEGLRTSGGSGGDGEDSDLPDEDEAPPRSGAGVGRKGKKASKKRNPDRINWLA